MTSSCVSSVIQSYDGIFKFVYAEEVQKPFLKARKCFADEQWAKGEEELAEALRQCKKPEDSTVVTLIMSEWNRYKMCKIPQGVEKQSPDWEAVRGRQPERLDEDHNALPQGIFILTLDKWQGQGRLQIAGRKTLSNLWLADKIPELFCSQIRADMLLGLMSDFRVTESKTTVFFNPFTPGEKLSLFEQIVQVDAKGTELVFPFPLLKSDSRKEFTSPEAGWDVDPNFDHTLSHGEVHIREYSVETLKRLGKTSSRLYDTACSTGVFLHSLKQAFPACTTIGQDLSQQMCDVAKARVDQVHCGNAMKPLIQVGSADVMYNRFLNSEVVTSAAAEALLSAVLSAVAPGGVAITFGHTPVLLTSSNFKMIDGFSIERCVGVAVDKSSIFQYYVMRRQ